MGGLALEPGTVKQDLAAGLGIELWDTEPRLTHSTIF